MNVKKIILLFIIVFFLIFMLPAQSNAQEIFFDNFDDGNASDWSVPRNTCSSNWQVNNNTYGIVISSGCVTETIPNNLNIPIGKITHLRLT